MPPENVFMPEAMHPALRVAFDWFAVQPMITGLLLLMIIDVLSGTCLAIVKRELSSTISWRGMSKKVIMLLLVGVAAVLEPYANGIPLSKLVATFYMITEALSIMENAAEAGVPLPAPLIDALLKLKESQRAARLAPRPGYSNNADGSATVRLEGSITVPQAMPLVPTEPDSSSSSAPKV